MKKITITETEINIEGFDNVEFKEPGKSGLDMGSCRDVSRVAMIWAIQKLVTDLGYDLTGEWESEICGMD